MNVVHSIKMINLPLVIAIILQRSSRWIEYKFQ